LAMPSSRAALNDRSLSGRQTRLDPLRSFAPSARAPAVQRKEPLTCAGFLAVQVHESWGRSAAVGVGRQPTSVGPSKCWRQSCPLQLGLIVGGADPRWRACR
jgi:hypothetical protein